MLRENHPNYYIWRGMLRRCNNPKADYYKYYGAKGISVCDRWYDFEVFCQDMGDRPSSDHTLDRIDSTGNYEPDNCRWATRKEQQRNTSANVYFWYQGKQRCIAELAEMHNLKYKVLYKRLIERNWELERALFTPVRSA